MKKLLLPTIMGSLLVCGTSAEVRVNLNPIGQKPVNTIRKTVATADILISQQFSDFDIPYVEGPIVSEYFSPENPNTPVEDDLTGDIPAFLMEGQEGWTGSEVYSNDGACVLRVAAAGSSIASYLRTPTNDYSGSLSISFIAKALPTYWYTYNEDGEEVTQAYSGSSICVGIADTDGRPIDVVDNYADQIANVRLYPDQGWCEIRIDVDNLSAYNNSFIEFYTTDIVEIDDIKITSSADKFIAPPVLKGVTDVTDTSFTINIEPVRKAYNYYVYLYTLAGYNPDGTPILHPALSPDDKATAEYYGISLEEYMEMILQQWDINEPYYYYGIIYNDTSYTFTDLDPNEQYFFGIRSHYVSQFSDLSIYEQVILPTPTALPPTQVTSNGFTAEWSKVGTADYYSVTLYGVETATDDGDGFVVFRDDFNKESGNTSGTLTNPEELDPEDQEAFYPYTDMKGWIAEYAQPLVADGMIGIRSISNWYYGGILSPMIYVKGAEQITVHGRILSSDPRAESFLLGCGEDYDYCGFDNGVWEGYMTFRTYGAEWLQITLMETEGGDLFIDYFEVSRDAKAGETILTSIESVDVENSTYFDFADLDTEKFRTYGYEVIAVRKSGSGTYTSEPSNLQTVDLDSSPGPNATNILPINENLEIEGIFSPTGQRVNRLGKGLNVIRYKDGSSRKVMVR